MTSPSASITPSVSQESESDSDGNDAATSVQAASVSNEVVAESSSPEESAAEETVQQDDIDQNSEELSATVTTEAAVEASAETATAEMDVDVEAAETTGQLDAASPTTNVSATQLSRTARVRNGETEQSNAAEESDGESSEIEEQDSPAEAAPVAQLVFADFDELFARVGRDYQGHVMQLETGELVLVPDGTRVGFESLDRSGLRVEISTEAAADGGNFAAAGLSSAASATMSSAGRLSTALGLTVLISWLGIREHQRKRQTVRPAS